MQNLWLSHTSNEGGAKNNLVSGPFGKQTAKGPVLCCFKVPVRAQLKGSAFRVEKSVNRRSSYSKQHPKYDIPILPAIGVVQAAIYWAIASERAKAVL
jgi:hypothetical protein